MIKQVEAGKLYLMVWGVLYECVGVTVEQALFRRMSCGPGFESYSTRLRGVQHEIEREATVDDIEKAMDKGLDRIENLANDIANERAVVRDLDEWRDRLEG